MKVLGIDPGADCGWAFYQGESYLSGVWHLNPKGSLCCGDHPLLYLKGHLRKVFDSVGPVDLIVFEEPVGYSQSIGRTVVAVAAGSQKVGIIVSEADSHGIHWLGLKPTDVKAFARRHDGLADCFPRKGQADKEAMWNAAKMYFHKTPSDHNEADALWVCAYGVENYEEIFKS